MISRFVRTAYGAKEPRDPLGTNRRDLFRDVHVRSKIRNGFVPEFFEELFDSFVIELWLRWIEHRPLLGAACHLRHLSRVVHVLGTAGAMAQFGGAWRDQGDRDSGAFRVAR